MGYNDIYRIAALIVKSIKGKESEEERNVETLLVVAQLKNL